MRQRYIARWPAAGRVFHEMRFRSISNEVIARIDFKLKLLDLGYTAPDEYTLEEDNEPEERSRGWNYPIRLVSTTYTEQYRKRSEGHGDQWVETNIEVGDILSYLLQPKDLPVAPERQWRGKVINVYPATEWTVSFLIVSLLEPGYEEMSEIVYPAQITGIERGSHGASSSGSGPTHD